MLELGRREQNLLGGLGIQILIVGVMVFAYTQAVRQVKLAGDLSQRLREQLVVAREQVARQGGKADLAALQAQVGELKASLAAPDALEAQAGRLKRLAARFNIRDLQMAPAEEPTEKLTIPLEGQPDFEIRLHRIEMTGSAPTRNLAALVKAVSDPSFKPICPLVAMQLEQASPADVQPVKFTLRWLIAVSPGSAAGVDQALPPAGESPRWGLREEPFQSPLLHPGAIKMSPDKTAGLKLSGILQEEEGFTCVINGQVLKPGDLIEDSQVVLITPTAVLLERKGEELLLWL